VNNCFSLNHWIVCPSSIYSFLLSLCYFQTFLIITMVMYKHVNCHFSYFTGIMLQCGDNRCIYVYIRIEFCWLLNKSFRAKIRVFQFLRKIDVSPSAILNWIFLDIVKYQYTRQDMKIDGLFAALTLHQTSYSGSWADNLPTSIYNIYIFITSKDYWINLMTYANVCTMYYNADKSGGVWS